MAKLEELLYQLMIGDASLKSMLATYASGPAVFELLAPDDSDTAWGGSQTPRIEYIAQRKEDPERQVSGSVTITVLQRGEALAVMAQIEARLRVILDTWTAQADEGTISLRWGRVDAFDQSPDYRGLEITYDLIAWPSGLTYAPDPVAALRTWASAKWTALQVAPGTWAPSDIAPALYWRLAAIEQTEPTNWGAWVTARLNGHVLAPSPGVRLQWVRTVTEGLAMDAQVMLSDGTPLTVQTAMADSMRDMLRIGQVQATVRFGVMATQPTYTQLNTANNTVTLTETTT